MMRFMIPAALLGAAACDHEEPARPPAPEQSAAPAPAAPEGAHPARNDERVSALSRRLRLDPSAGFSQIWIDHEPRYSVVLAFKGPVEREAILALADPALRPFIEFRPASRTQAEIERDGDRLIAALRGMPGEWAGGYEVETERFVFTVGTPAAQAWAREHVPADLRGGVDFRIGSVPQPLGR
jgi:hypothetical protein